MHRVTFLMVAAVLAGGPALAQSAASSSNAAQPVPAAPAAPAAPVPFTLQIYGPGTISCATYLNDRSIRINADGWILGFWTGNNRGNPENHQVGQSTDSRGIVGEVARVCRGQPSVSLFQTEREIYDRMKGEGR